MKTQQALMSEHTVSVSVSAHSAPQVPRAIELNRSVQTLQCKVCDGNWGMEKLTGFSVFKGTIDQVTNLFLFLMNY